MSRETSTARFAAAVYRPDGGDRMALLRFVEHLQADGVRVGGLLQEAQYDSQGVIAGVYAIDVASGRRIPITRPVKSDEECGLDVSALVETSGIIRQAIDERFDLIVVEKFGEQEQSGKGLIDEILQGIAEGIPLLISVPEVALPLWQERTGELGAVLGFNEESFRQWWQQINQGN
ncbi:MAG: DUF2478 domain-containing protein [Gammaproteobacteria bacterium]|nr:MAG: DUF2478 domain-containing protein [Gammaproteobacteria bacterium]